MRHRRGSAIEHYKRRNWSLQHNNQSNLQKNKNFRGNRNQDQNANPDKNKNWDITGTEHFHTKEGRRPVNMFGNNDTLHEDMYQTSSDVACVFSPSTFRNDQSLVPVNTLPSFASTFDVRSTLGSNVPGSSSVLGQSSTKWMSGNNFSNSTRYAGEFNDMHSRNINEPNMTAPLLPLLMKNIPTHDVNFGKSFGDINTIGYSSYSPHYTSIAKPWQLNLQPASSVLKSSAENRVPNDSGGLIPSTTSVSSATSSWQAHLQPTSSSNWCSNLVSETSFDVSDIPLPPYPPPSPQSSAHSQLTNVQSSIGDSRPSEIIEPIINANESTRHGDKSMMDFNGNCSIDNVNRPIASVVYKHALESDRFRDMQETLYGRSDKTSGHNIHPSTKCVGVQNSSHVDSSREQNFEGYQRPYVRSTLSGIGMHNSRNFGKYEDSLTQQQWRSEIQSSQSNRTLDRQGTSTGALSLMKSLIEQPLFPDNGTQFLADEAFSSRDGNVCIDSEQNTKNWTQSSSYESTGDQEWFPHNDVRNKKALHRPWEFSVTRHRTFDGKFRNANTSSDDGRFRNEARQDRVEQQRLRRNFYSGRRFRSTPHCFKRWDARSNCRKTVKYIPDREKHYEDDPGIRFGYRSRENRTGEHRLYEKNNGRNSEGFTRKANPKNSCDDLQEDVTVSAAKPVTDYKKVDKQCRTLPNEPSEHGIIEGGTSQEDRSIVVDDGLSEAEQSIPPCDEAEKSREQVSEPKFLKKRQDKYNGGKPYTEIIPLRGDASNRCDDDRNRKKVRFVKEICAATSSTDIDGSKPQSKSTASSVSPRNVVLPLHPSTVAMPLVNTDMSKLSDAIPKVNRFLTSLSKVAKPDICLENKYLKSKKKLEQDFSVKSISCFKIPRKQSTTTVGEQKVKADKKSQHKKIVSVSPLIKNIDDKKEKDVKKNTLSTGTKSGITKKEINLKSKESPTRKVVNTVKRKIVTKPIGLKSMDPSKVHPKLRHKMKSLGEKSPSNLQDKYVKQSMSVSKNVMVKNLINMPSGDTLTENAESNRLAQLPCCVKRGKFVMSSPNTYEVKDLYKQPVKTTNREKSNIGSEASEETFNKAMFSAKKHLLYRAMAMQALARDKTNPVYVKKKGVRTSGITYDMAEREISCFKDDVLKEMGIVDAVVQNSESNRINTDEIDINNNIVNSSDKTGKAAEKSTGESDMSITEQRPAGTKAECLLTQCISGPQVSSTVYRSCNTSTKHSSHEAAEQVSVPTNLSATVVCVSSVHGTSYDNENTEYYASKLTKETLKDVDLSKETERLSFEHPSSPKSCHSDRSTLSSDSPCEAGPNNDQFEMHRRYLFTKCEVLPLEKVSLEGTVQKIPILPALLPPIPCQQAGIVLNASPCPDQTADRSDEKTSPCHPSSSVTEYQMKYSPTVEDFERYKRDQVKRISSQGLVDQQHSPYNAISDSPEIAANSSECLNNEQHWSSSPSNVWDNSCSPKIVCVQSLNAAFSQCNESDVVNSSLQANPMIEFVNDLQCSPKAFFDEIVDDILMDNDLINSITVETQEEKGDENIIKPDSVNDSCFRDTSCAEKTSENGSSNVQGDVDNHGNKKSEFRSARNMSLYSNRKHRFQKRFPKPLPRTKMINKEKELYIAATQFLGNFDLKSKRSCREVPKDSPLINPTSGKMEIVDSQTKAFEDTVEKSISSVSEMHAEQNSPPTRNEVSCRQENEVESVKPQQAVVKNIRLEKKVEINEIESKKKVPSVETDSKKKVPSLRLRPVRSDCEDSAAKPGQEKSKLKWKAISSNEKLAGEESLEVAERYKLKRRTSRDKNKSASKKRRCLSPLPTTSDAKYFCEVCEFPSDSQMKQRLHFNFYHSLWCFKCAKMCVDDEARTEHMREVHNIVASCKVCGTNFSFKSKYKIHLQSQCHADNLQKLNLVKKEALYSNPVQNNSDMVVISDDEFSEAEDVLPDELLGLANREMKQEPACVTKGQRDHVAEKCVKSLKNDSGLKGVKRKLHTDLASSGEDGGKNIGQFVGVGKYCDVCHQFYKKFRAHKSTYKHMENEMAAMSVK